MVLFACFFLCVTLPPDRKDGVVVVVEGVGGGVEVVRVVVVARGVFPFPNRSRPIASVLFSLGITGRVVCRVAGRLPGFPVVVSLFLL